MESMVTSEWLMQIGYMLAGICIGMLIGFYTWYDGDD